MRIEIKGAIINNSEKWIYDLFDIEATCPKDVNSQLKTALNKDVEVVVNSGGGDVFSGSEIYTSLKDHSGKVTVKIVGVAASAASVIAMAGDETLISPTAQIMIHNASMVSAGDHRDFTHDSNFLKGWDKSIANAYILKSGMDMAELLNMMDKETWLNAQESKEKGFVDEIMFENNHQPSLVASANHTQMLPPEVINKIRNEAMNQSQSDGNVPQIDNKNGKDDENMDMEKLKNDYPELYKQIKNEGYSEGITAENERIKAIEDMAVPGHEELVNQAKFETKEKAEALAMNIIKAQKEQGHAFLQNRANDAPTNVGGSSAPEGNSNETQRDESANIIANFVNKARGGIQ